MQSMFNDKPVATEKRWFLLELMVEIILRNTTSKYCQWTKHNEKVKFHSDHLVLQIRGHILLVLKIYWLRDTVGK